MPQVSIEATELGKDYNLQQIFCHLSETFQAPQPIAVIGHNGSGKSTLLRVLSGMDSPTMGRVQWTVDGKALPAYRQYEYLSFCSPGFLFDHRFTVREIMRQYLAVKPMQNGLTADDLIAEIGFEKHHHKHADELSSGMNQRVRLVLTICAEAPVLFLDEPCSNLDQQGVEWYLDLISRYAHHKLVFVASNDEREYRFCTRQISMMKYKG
ncbi:MAG TPA: ATP-binding cassette domain-containing protein [Membranihabitans sp.]|nr:ATP-binding cassette domain-containing protein [Membranihabitans sp.]